MEDDDVRPVRGILKQPSDLDNRDLHRNKEMKWDEMNIMATHHPTDKDYGFMKIEEPKTPYSKYEEPEDETLERRGSDACMDRRPRRTSTQSSDEVDSVLDPQTLADRLNNEEEPRVLRDDEADSDEESDFLTEEDKAKRKSFEQKRKIHYNEYQAVKLAKQLMEQEEEEDEENEENEHIGTEEGTTDIPGDVHV